jgi:hypothetical protein
MKISFVNCVVSFSAKEGELEAMVNVCDCLFT